MSWLERELQKFATRMQHPGHDSHTAPAERGPVTLAIPMVSVCRTLRLTQDSAKTSIDLLVCELRLGAADITTLP